MNYQLFIWLHLATIVPSFFIGGFLLLNKKGTNIHKRLGKIYMVLMLLTAFFTLFMSEVDGPKLFGHFGYLHIFTFLVLYQVPRAYFAVKKGNIKTHRFHMMLLYFGGILLAGTVAFQTGRFLNDLFF